MKTFLVLIILELFKIVMSSSVHRTGFPHFLKRTRHHHRGRQAKSNLKLHTYPHLAKPDDASNEQDSMLERTSPEYRYNDEVSNKNVEKTQDGTSSAKLTQDLPLGSTQHKSIGSGINGIGIGVRPMAIGPPDRSLEELNMMLTSSLSEYKYDKGATGSNFNKCADLDPDCPIYELEGLCSDSPTFTLKQFNCKKTCHLCL